MRVACKPNPEQQTNDDQPDPKTNAVTVLWEVSNVSLALSTLLDCQDEYRYDASWSHGVLSGVRTVLEWMTEKSGDAADALSGGDA
jgi:hypothetical protein